MEVIPTLENYTFFFCGETFETDSGLHSTDVLIALLNALLYSMMSMM